MSGLRVVSYGGGVQSTALLALAAAGKLAARTERGQWRASDGE